MSRLLVFFVMLSSLSFLCCNSGQKEQETLLINRAKSIIVNSEASSARQIEGVIASIRSFLSEHPDSRHFTELNEYIEELMRSLDVHKVKEYVKEYENLLSKTYYDGASAIQTLDGFLNHFTSDYGTQLLARKPQLQSCLDEVREIKSEFRQMNAFFDRNYYDIASFNSELQSNAYLFRGSRYETVRTSWEKIADSKRNELVQKEMEKKVANFEDYLRNDAENICIYNYSNFVVNRAERTQTISISSPVQHDTYNAQVCEGIFRVYMKGAFIGWDKGTVRIKVKGMICVKVDANRVKIGVEYDRIDFSVLETTGDLK